MSSLLLKVANAIERGTLHKSVAVHGDRDQVEIRDLYVSYSPLTDLARSHRTIAWVRREFPDGDTRSEGNFQHTLPRMMHSHSVKRIRIDRARYRSGPMSCIFLREHEHDDEYKADTRGRDRRGNVQWLHTCCNEPIGIRTARELGLTP